MWWSWGSKPYSTHACKKAPRYESLPRPSHCRSANTKTSYYAHMHTCGTYTHTTANTQRLCCCRPCSRPLRCSARKGIEKCTNCAHAKHSFKIHILQYRRRQRTGCNIWQLQRNQLCPFSLSLSFRPLSMQKILGARSPISYDFTRTQVLLLLATTPRRIHRPRPGMLSVHYTSASLLLLLPWPQ